MSDKLYDILNKVQRWLPALAAFYLGLSAIWPLPYGNEVNKTIALIATFLAATLEVFSARWNKDHEVIIKPLKENGDTNVIG